MPQTPPREDAAAAAERCSRTPSCLAQAEAEIRAFIFHEHADVDRSGLLHNTGLLLWNMSSERARASAAPP